MVWTAAWNTYARVEAMKELPALIALTLLVGCSGPTGGGGMAVEEDAFAGEGTSAAEFSAASKDEHGFPQYRHVMFGFPFP